MDEKDVENASKETAADFEDASNRELASVSVAPRLTAADVSKDQKSLNRCLDRHLLLVTRTRIGDTCKWLLPFARNEGNESLRQVSERRLLLVSRL